MVLKNDEKMMVAWMAKKSDIGDYDPARPLATRAQGGGGGGLNPSSKGSWEERDWKE